MSKNTHHMFNIYIAKELGVNSAIILENMMFWLERNEIKGINYHDGYYWTYNTADELSKHFPYLTARQIRYALDDLEKKGIVLTGNYNKYSYDRTKWYTISEEGKSLLQNVSCQVTKCNMSFIQNVTTIPDINTDINTDIKDIGQVEEKLDNPPQDKIPYNEVIDYLNKTANRNFRNVDSNKRLIRARFNEGYDLDDFKQVIDNMVTLWGNDHKMKNYIRPKTLFGTKFDDYLNTEVKEGKEEFKYAGEITI